MAPAHRHRRRPGVLARKRAASSQAGMRMGTQKAK